MRHSAPRDLARVQVHNHTLAANVHPGQPVAGRRAVRVYPGLAQLRCGDNIANLAFGQSALRVRHLQYMKHPLHPELQSDAHRLVRKAKLEGVLVAQPCEVCGKAKTEAHHDDYSKPLDVRWLCRSHHQELHGNGGVRSMPIRTDLTAQEWVEFRKLAIDLGGTASGTAGDAIRWYLREQRALLKGDKP